MELTRFRSIEYLNTKVRKDLKGFGYLAPHDLSTSNKCIINCHRYSDAKILIQFTRLERLSYVYRTEKGAQLEKLFIISVSKFFFSFCFAAAIFMRTIFSIITVSPYSPKIFAHLITFSGWYGCCVAFCTWDIHQPNWDKHLWIETLVSRHKADQEREAKTFA